MRGFKRFKEGRVVYYYHEGVVNNDSRNITNATSHSISDSVDSDSTATTDKTTVQNTESTKFSPIICHGLGFGKNYYITLIDKLLKLGRPILTAPQLQAEQAIDRDLIARFRLPFNVIKAAVQDDQARSKARQSMFRAKRKTAKTEGLQQPSVTGTGTGTVWDSIRDMIDAPSDNMKVGKLVSGNDSSISMSECSPCSSETAGSIPIKSDWSQPETVDVEEYCQSNAVIIRFTERDREKFRYRRGSEALRQWEKYEDWNEKRIDSELLLCSAKNLTEVFVPRVPSDISKQKAKSERLLDDSRKLNEQFVTL